MSADERALETAAAPAAPPAYRDANVLRWIAAYTASVTGDVTYFLALSWAVVSVAGPAQTGFVTAVGALPRALLLLAGGVVADRFGPRRVALASDAVRCAVVLGTAAALALTSPGLWLLTAVALVFGVVDAMFMPAVGALPPRLTSHDQLVRVQGMRGLSIRVSNLVGPLLAAAVLVAAGPSGAFAAAGVLFAVSLPLLLRVRIAPVGGDAAEKGAGAGRATPMWQELKEGLGYIRRHRVLTRLVTVIGLSEICFSGPVVTGLVLLADERGWGASGVGLTAGAFSIGGGAAALFGTLGRMPRAGTALLGALAVTAVATAGLGYVPALFGAVALSAAAGLGSGLTTTVTGALLQTETEPRYLGRVTSVSTLCTLGLAPLLLPATGVVVAAWGSGVFFAACGAVCTAAAALTLTSAALRRATG